MEKTNFKISENTNELLNIWKHVNEVSSEFYDWATGDVSDETADAIMAGPVYGDIWKKFSEIEDLCCELLRNAVNDNFSDLTPCSEI